MEVENTSPVEGVKEHEQDFEVCINDDIRGLHIGDI